MCLKQVDSNQEVIILFRPNEPRRYSVTLLNRASLAYFDNWDILL